MLIRLYCALSIVVGLSLPAAQAAQVVTEPFLGVRYTYQTETSPRPLRIHVMEVDLGAPGISFQLTPGGPHPRPIGTNAGYAGQPMETIRQTTRQFLDSVDAQVAINGSFYSSQSFSGVLWANNLGLTVSNGEKYSPWESPSTADFDDALNITQDNDARIVKMPASIPTGYETNPTVPLYNTVTGSHRLVQNGSVVAPSSCGNLCLLHPRTAVGLTANNEKLIMMTVDGRRSGISEGVSLVELANLMTSHGATNAINLDGGGSTTMVMDQYGDGLAGQVLNLPSDGSERAVGTNLALFALPNGDYNEDGVVDAADYVVWRKSIGNPLAYDAWKKQYDATTSGAGGESGASVPEPAAALLVGLAMVQILLVRRSSL